MGYFAEICCTVSETLWEYRSGSARLNLRLAALINGDVLHMMAVNADKEIVEHYIVKNPGAGFEAFVCNNLGIKEPEWMDSTAPFELLPTGFADMHLPGLPPLKHCRKINAENTLCSGVSHGFHAALPFYLKAASAAALYENYTGFWYNGNSVLVAFFQHGKCILFNQYATGNEAEALYFVLAPSEKADLPVSSVRIEVLCDSEFQKPLADAMSRFIPELALMKIELPYENGQYPPFLSESYLLYSYLTCALPEAN